MCVCEINTGGQASAGASELQLRRVRAGGVGIPSRTTQIIDVSDVSADGKDRGDRARGASNQRRRNGGLTPRRELEIRGRVAFLCHRKQRRRSLLGETSREYPLGGQDSRSRRDAPPTGAQLVERSVSNDTSSRPRRPGKKRRSSSRYRPTTCYRTGNCRQGSKALRSWFNRSARCADGGSRAANREGAGDPASVIARNELGTHKPKLAKTGKSRRGMRMPVRW